MRSLCASDRRTGRRETGGRGRGAHGREGSERSATMDCPSHCFASVWGGRRQGDSLPLPRLARHCARTTRCRVGSGGRGRGFAQRLTRARTHAACTHDCHISLRHWYLSCTDAALVPMLFHVCTVWSYACRVSAHRSCLAAVTVHFLPSQWEISGCLSVCHVAPPEPVALCRDVMCEFGLVVERARGAGFG